MSMDDEAVQSIRDEITLLRASLLEDELSFEPALELDPWVRSPLTR